ncbi:MAG: hypothetical protein HQM10_24270 [Candidatus Riflebacteria bacterium]|nr:hypothetical protein [Candidatus Riflebacteria bacterium]
MKLKSIVIKCFFVLAFAFLISPSLFATNDVFFKLTTVMQKVSTTYIPKSGENVLTRRSGCRYLVVTKNISTKDDLEREMNANSGGELDDGQQKMVDTMAFSEGDEIKKLLALGQKNRKTEIDVTVEIFDTTFVDDVDASVVIKDFWPCSYIGMNKIDFSTCYFNSYVTAEPQSVLVHEISHAIDKNSREPNSYGPDNSHQFFEVTMPRSAYLEGWAIYNQYRVFPGPNNSSIQNLDNVVKNWVTFERNTGGYQGYSTSKVTGGELLNVEGINALVLYKLSKQVGQTQVENSFLKSNTTEVKLGDFLTTFAKTYPSSVKTVFTILNEQTFGTLEDSEITSLLGTGKTVLDLLKTRASPPYSTAPALDLQKTLNTQMAKLKQLMALKKPFSSTTKKSILDLKAQFEETLGRLQAIIDSFKELNEDKAGLISFSPLRQTKLKEASNTLDPIATLFSGFKTAVANFVINNGIAKTGRLANED